MEFCKESKEKIEALKRSYPTFQSALLPVLWIAQEEFGFLSKKAMALVAGVLELPEIYVEQTASFYTMYNKKAVGKYHVQVCRNISCDIMGCSPLIEHLSKRLGVQPGETTANGLFTLDVVECLGSCGTAPALMVNRTYHENLTLASIDTLVDQLQSEGVAQ